MFNGLPIPHEETLEPSYPLAPLPNPVALPSTRSERLIINITVNRVCRLFSILGLGFGGGWSFIPDEKRVPTSTTWVIFLVILTDWIAVTAVLDCVWPAAMDWYFRSPVRAKFLYTSANNNPCPPMVKITLYRFGNTLLALGYLLARVIKRRDDGFLSTVEYIAGGLGICSLWAGWAESDNRGMKWLFQDDYRDVLLQVVTFLFALATWWWIAYRIVAVVIILRHRNDKEMKTRFQILMVGLAVEGSALCIFLAIPILRRAFKNMPWHEKLWYSHRVASIAMLVFWAVVLIIGFGDELPNILFPCTDSKVSVCSILISYPS